MTLTQLTFLCFVVWSAAYVIAEPALIPTVQLSALLLIVIGIFLLIANAIVKAITRSEKGSA